MSIAAFSFHKELAFGSDAGLSNYEVLKTATVNASQTFSMMNQLGIIEEGKMANLLLVDENSLVHLFTFEKLTCVRKQEKIESSDVGFLK